jgi:hypothetical protein
MGPISLPMEDAAKFTENKTLDMLAFSSRFFENLHYNRANSGNMPSGKLFDAKPEGQGKSSVG